MEVIKKRQNEPTMLKIQYAARLSYNRAEKIGWWVWLAAILAEVCVFLPSSTHGAIQWGLPVILNVTAGILSYRYKRNIENGAMLRNYFDSYVLDLAFNQNDDQKKRKMRDLALRLVRNHEAEANTQVNNSGRDTPPGVKDWYEFRKPTIGDAAILECQMQNRWWTKDMMIECIRERASVAFIVLVVFVVLLLLFPNSFWNIVICSTGLFFRSIERLVAYIQFYKTSGYIDVIIHNLGSGYQKTNLIGLQDHFIALRMIPVTGSNRLHRKHAQQKSVEYSSIID